MKVILYAFIGVTLAGFYFLYKSFNCVQCLGDTQFLYFVGATLAMGGIGLLVAVGGDIEEAKFREARANNVDLPKKTNHVKVLESTSIILFSLFLFFYIVGGAYFGFAGLRAEHNSQEQIYNQIETAKWNKGEVL